MSPDETSTHRADRSTGRPGPRAALAVLALLLVVSSALALGILGAQQGSPRGAATVHPASRPASGQLPAADVAPVAPSGAAPTRLVVPAIGVDADVGRLGLHPDGSIEVPADPADAGWVAVSSSPGTPGPAVLAGHLDSRSGPAVFYRLASLRPGERIEVTGARGATEYRVDRVQRYPRSAFPSAAVYGPTPGPTLRLITCGGEYDAARGGYQDNVVVFAS